MKKLDRECVEGIIYHNLVNDYNEGELTKAKLAKKWKVTPYKLDKILKDAETKGFDVEWRGKRKKVPVVPLPPAPEPEPEPLPPAPEPEGPDGPDEPDEPSWAYRLGELAWSGAGTALKGAGSVLYTLGGFSLRRWKPLAVTAGVLLVTLPGGAAVYNWATSGSAETGREAPEKINKKHDAEQKAESPNASAAEAANYVPTILGYLNEPGVSELVMRDVFGNTAKPELIDSENRMLYFTVPKSEFSDELLERITTRPDLVQELTWSQYAALQHLDMSDVMNIHSRLEDKQVFGVNYDHLNIDPEKRVKKVFGRHTYEVSVSELHDFLSNRTVHGGELVAVKKFTETAYGGHIEGLLNHGAFVAKKGEASLSRLVEQITTRYGIEGNERIAQQLLDFVRENIKYDHGEAAASVETLNRPNEVLLRGEADCSGHAILYSSLLEQAGIDHLLVYSTNDQGRGHISVAVAGNFNNDNNLAFDWNGRTYHIAESCINRRFIIGESRAVGLKFENFDYLQVPGKDSKIFDMDGNYLPFESEIR
jgi:hypothetical protein